MGVAERSARAIQVAATLSAAIAAIAWAPAAPARAQVPDASIRTPDAPRIGAPELPPLPLEPSLDPLLTPDVWATPAPAPSQTEPGTVDEPVANTDGGARDQGLANRESERPARGGGDAGLGGQSDAAAAPRSQRSGWRTSHRESRRGTESRSTPSKGAGRDGAAPSARKRQSAARSRRDGRFAERSQSRSIVSAQRRRDRISPLLVALMVAALLASGFAVGWRVGARHASRREAPARQPTKSESHVGLPDLLRLVRGHRSWIAVAIALTLAASALGIVQPLVVKQVIESAGAGPVVLGMILLLIGLFVAQALVQATGRYVLARESEGVVLGIRLNLIHHLLRLRMAAYEQHRTGDLISRISTDGMVLRRVVAEGLADAVSGVLGLTATVALMIWLDWVLFVIVGALVVTGALAVLTVLRGIREASLHAQRSSGEMTADLERALSAIRTVRASRSEGRESARIGAQARSVYAASVQMAKLDAVVRTASELALHGSFIVVLLVGGLRVADGASSVAELVAFLLYMTYLVAPIDAVFQAISAIQQGTGAIQRIKEFLGLPRESDPAPVASAGRGQLGGVASPARDSTAPVLEFRDVRFGYERRRPVLRGVSFQVPHRGHVALIGRSGAGKSTIFALIERFYDPDIGEILFDGTDVRDVDREEHRARIGLVEQHCPLLYGTLRDNVTYVAPDAGEPEIERVIELASLTDLLERLPHGLDTAVGEHGMKLSGGERQRIAIARSLLAAPRLLLLDEPTAHLDPINEAALGEAIDRIASECALLVIAHRFSTVRRADHIVALQHGTVVAAGSHEELLDVSEYYRGLAERFASRPVRDRTAGVSRA